MQNSNMIRGIIIQYVVQQLTMQQCVVYQNRAVGKLGCRTCSRQEQRQTEIVRRLQIGPIITVHCSYSLESIIKSRLLVDQRRQRTLCLQSISRRWFLIERGGFITIYQYILNTISSSKQQTISNLHANFTVCGVNVRVLNTELGLLNTTFIHGQH